MIQTSYYANSKNFPKSKALISISRYTPEGYPLSGYAKELYPSEELLSSYKDGMISEEQYVETYKKETLSELCPHEISKKYKDAIFLCYEKAGDFCHRRIVSAWLAENGIPCPEIEDKSVGIAIVGSRGFTDYSLMTKMIKKLTSNFKNFHLVSGGARGADFLSEKYAKENNIKINVFQADWSLGKSAGYIRNHVIWDNADMGIAFWDGESKGTAHNFELARKQNKTLYVVDYKRNKVYAEYAKKIEILPPPPPAPKTLF